MYRVTEKKGTNRITLLNTLLGGDDIWAKEQARWLTVCWSAKCIKLGNSIIYWKQHLPSMNAIESIWEVKLFHNVIWWQSFEVPACRMYGRLTTALLLLLFIYLFIYLLLFSHIACIAWMPPIATDVRRSVVCVSVFGLHWCTVQKRLNLSRCHLGCWLR